MISGGGGLTISGGSAETLAGTNTYTGATTINGGTLALSGTGSIATSSGVSLATAGTFDISQTTLGASITTLSDTGSGQAGKVKLGSQTLTITNGSTTFSGVISGGGGLTISGGSAETLAGTNTYTGATTITGGTLALSGTGSIATSSGVSLATAGTFDISQTSAGASIATLSDTGSGQAGKVKLGSQTLTITNGSTTFSGVISGGGGLTISGGTETLAGTNTYTGATTINAGATLAGGAANTFSANSAVTNNGTLDLGSVNQTIASLSGSGTVTNLTNPTNVTVPAVALLTIGNGGSFAGKITDGSVSGVTTALTLNGGTLTLSGTYNDYSGATTINTGAKLAGGTANAFSANSDVTLNGTGTLDLGSLQQTIKSLNSTAGTTLVGNYSGGPGAGELVVGNGGSFAGKITDGSVGGSTTALTLNGGTLTLSGTHNDYSGATTVNTGATLAGGATNTFSASSAVKVSAAGTVDLGGFNQKIFSLADGTGGGGGTVTSMGSSNAVLTISGGAATAFSGAITDGTKTTGLTLKKLQLPHFEWNEQQLLGPDTGRRRHQRQHAQGRRRQCLQRLVGGAGVQIEQARSRWFRPEGLLAGRRHRWRVYGHQQWQLQCRADHQRRRGQQHSRAQSPMARRRQG